MLFLSHCKTWLDRWQNYFFRRFSFANTTSVRSVLWLCAWCFVVVVKAIFKIRKF